MSPRLKTLTVSSWCIMDRALVHSTSLGRVRMEPAPPFSHPKCALYQSLLASLVVAVKPLDESGSAMALLFREGTVDCEHAKVRECATIMSS